MTRPAYTFPDRQPLNGHHPDCPYPGRPARHCPICRAIALAQPDHEPGQRPALRLLVACTTCYAPVDAGRPCRRCTPEETDRG